MESSQAFDFPALIPVAVAAAALSDVSSCVITPHLVTAVKTVDDVIIEYPLRAAEQPTAKGAVCSGMRSLAVGVVALGPT